MTPLIALILVVAAYAIGRIHQFVRDARSVMGTGKYEKNRW
jgi:hypothetical protein